VQPVLVDRLLVVCWWIDCLWCVVGSIACGVDRLLVVRWWIDCGWCVGGSIVGSIVGGVLVEHCCGVLVDRLLAVDRLLVVCWIDCLWCVGSIACGVLGSIAGGVLDRLLVLWVVWCVQRNALSEEDCSGA
jgi:hypothetical protein